MVDTWSFSIYKTSGEIVELPMNITSNGDNISPTACPLLDEKHPGLDT